MDIIQSFEHTVVNQICHSLNIGSLENTSRVPLSGGGVRGAYDPLQFNVYPFEAYPHYYCRFIRELTP